MKVQNTLLLAVLTVALISTGADLNAQCCAGASPFAGGSSFQVGLAKGQFDVSSKYQYTYGDDTYNGDIKRDFKLVDKEYSSYVFPSIGYGLTDKLSLYMSMGYYIHKTEKLMIDTIVGTGFSDLIMMPKYQVFSVRNENNYNELSASMGIKIPIGTYNLDRITYINKKTGDTIRTVNPISTQPSTGSNDFIFDLYYFRTMSKVKLNYTANVNYIMRGTNPDGQVFGDILTVTTGVTKQLFKGFSLAFDVKGMKLDSIVDPIFLSQQRNTGLKKVSLVPSIYVTPAKNLTFLLSFDYSFYQYVKGSQPITEYIGVAGLVYRFNILKEEEEEKKTVID